MGKNYRWIPRLYRLAPYYSGIIVILAGLFASKTQGTVQYSYQAERLEVAQPIKIDFTRPVNARFNYNLSPGAPGSWKQKRNIFGVTGLEFVPEKPLLPSKSYQIILGGMHLVTGQAVPEQTITVSTRKPAAVSNLTPKDSAKGIAVNSIIELKLSDKNSGLRQLNLRTSPSIDLAALPSPDDQTFQWKPSQPLTQGTSYTVEVLDEHITRTGKPAVIAHTTFTTVAAPKITAATITNHLLPGEPITINFDQAMRPDQKPSFETAGSGQWATTTAYVFKPTGLIPGKSYNYRVPKGFAAFSGGLTEAEAVYTVATPGQVYLAASSPNGSGISRSAKISLTFDQAVDHASAQQRLSISPSVGLGFSWSGNTLTATPASLEWQSTYTVTVAPGLQPTFGLPNASPLSFRFTTEIQTIKLPVPSYRQTYAQSCEASALRMALAYRGINVNDLDITTRLNYNPHLRDVTTNSWDNPNVMFVGDINGNQKDGTGWGVNADPIASAAISLGRNAQAVHGISVQTIAANVHAGNPVIIWGYGTSLPYAAYMDSWNSPDGVINAVIGEHVRTVIGVYGSPSNPLGFYLNDPFYGPLYWSSNQLAAQLYSFGAASNQAVIVY